MIPSETRGEAALRSFSTFGVSQFGQGGFASGGTSASNSRWQSEQRNSNSGMAYRPEVTEFRSVNPV